MKAKVLNFPPKNPRYMQQKELMATFKLHFRNIKRLEAAGLKRIKFSPDSRVVFYDVEQFHQVLAKLSV